MKEVQDNMACYANQEHMEPPPFCVGECVYIWTDHICMNRTACKLAEKKICPFPIISQPLSLSFTIQLPSTIHIHPVFHVSQLEPEHPNTFEDYDQLPPPPLIVDG